MRPPDAEGPGAEAPRDPHNNAGLDTDTAEDNPVRDLLDGFIGLEIDGGCDDCPAYQTIERVADGVYVNHIFHDDTCPWWIRHQAATP